MSFNTDLNGRSTLTFGEDTLARYISDLKFMKEFDITFEDAADATKKVANTTLVYLRELQDNLKTLSHKQCDISGHTLTISGTILGTSDVILPPPNYDHPITEINVYGSHSLIFDGNITAPGVNVTLLSPYWYLTQNNPTIDVSGVNGALVGPMVNTPGSDGLSGNHGQHGGNVYAHYLSVFYGGDDTLHIFSNGGNGSDGLNGVDGARGRDGELLDHHIELEEKVDSTGIPFLSLNSAIKKKVRIAYKGQPGKPGGNGGANGLGGHNGDIEIEAHPRIHLIASVGQGGSAGDPGQGGNGGLYPGLIEVCDLGDETFFGKIEDPVARGFTILGTTVGSLGIYTAYQGLSYAIKNGGGMVNGVDAIVHNLGILSARIALPPEQRPRAPYGANGNVLENQPLEQRPINKQQKKVQFLVRKHPHLTPKDFF